MISELACPTQVSVNFDSRTNISLSRIFPVLVGICFFSSEARLCRYVVCTALWVSFKSCKTIRHFFLSKRNTTIWLCQMWFSEQIVATNATHVVFHSCFSININFCFCMHLMFQFHSFHWVPPPSEIDPPSPFQWPDKSSWFCQHLPHRITQRVWILTLSRQGLSALWKLTQPVLFIWGYLSPLFSVRLWNHGLLYILPTKLEPFCLLAQRAPLVAKKNMLPRQEIIYCLSRASEGLFDNYSLFPWLTEFKSWRLLTRCHARCQFNLFCSLPQIYHLSAQPPLSAICGPVCRKGEWTPPSSSGTSNSSWPRFRLPQPNQEIPGCYCYHFMNLCRCHVSMVNQRD